MCADVKGNSDLSFCMPFRRGSRVECSCWQGFTLQGSPILTCGYNARFNGPMPTCVQSFDGEHRKSYLWICGLPLLLFLSLFLLPSFPPFVCCIYQTKFERESERKKGEVLRRTSGPNFQLHSIVKSCSCILVKRFE